MAVLYGVFMFMGVSALKGMQVMSVKKNFLNLRFFFQIIYVKFIERILILFMPAKHQPDYKYLRYVSTYRVHLFTVIQLISTSGLYLIKYIESVAILFPILVTNNNNFLT